MSPTAGSAERQYVRNALAAYLALPDTPHRAHPGDRQFARHLCRSGISLMFLRRALLLGIARRLARAPDSAPLPPVRSLAYFRGIIEETRHQPVDSTYVQHLEKTIARLSSPALPTPNPPENRSAHTSDPSPRSPRQLTIDFSER